MPPFGRVSLARMPPSAETPPPCAGDASESAERPPVDALGVGFEVPGACALLEPSEGLPPPASGSHDAEASAESARKRREGLLALAVVQLCFGLFPVFGKLAMQSFDPRAVTAWRIAVGALVLGGGAFAAFGKRALPTWRDLVLLQIAGTLGISLNQLLFLHGLELSTATNAGVLVCLIPVFTFGIATLIRQERFSWLRALGLGVALAGVLPLVLARGEGFSLEHARGNALMVVNAACYSLYLVVTRPLTARYSPFVVIGWAYVLCLWQVPLLLGSAPWIPSDATPGSYGSLVYVLIGPTLIAYLLNMVALARVRASTAAAWIYVQPLIAATAAIFVLGERPSWRTVVAAVAIFGGLWMVLHFGRPRPGRAARQRTAPAVEVRR